MSLDGGREQLGAALFDTIFTIGQILAEERRASMFAGKGDEESRKEAYRAAQNFRASLTKQIERLSDADAAAVVKRYPWVLEG